MDVEGGPSHEVLKSLVDIQKGVGDRNKRMGAQEMEKKLLTQALSGSAMFIAKGTEHAMKDEFGLNYK